MRLINCLFVLVISLLWSQLTWSKAELACPEFPYFQPTEGPLAVVNCDFHKSYEQRITDLLKTFGAKGGKPLILNLGGTLVLKANGESKTVSITPDRYHAYKTYAHAFFAIYLSLSNQTSHLLNKLSRDHLEHLQKDLGAAFADLSKSAIPLEDHADITSFVNMTNRFLNTILKEKSCPQLLLDQYVRDAWILIKPLVKKAAAVELQLLDTNVNDWLRTLTDAEKKHVTIVVAASHQARAKEISIQYFMHRFGVKVGEGALKERDFVVLEGKFDEDSALRLLARHYLDREVGSAILHDAEGLQRDLLSDAAKEWLKERRR